MHTRDKGKMGEALACRYLVSMGYQIIDRNVYVGHRELDIVARKQNVLYIIEVKSQFEMTGEFVHTHVSRQKYLSIFSAAKQYCLQNRVEPNFEMLFIKVNVLTQQKRAQFELIPVKFHGFL